MGRAKKEPPLLTPFQQDLSRRFNETYPEGHPALLEEDDEVTEYNIGGPYRGVYNPYSDKKDFRGVILNKSFKDQFYELCNTFKQSVGASFSDHELDLFLAYLRNYAEKGMKGKLIFFNTPFLEGSPVCITRENRADLQKVLESEGFFVEIDNDIMMVIWGF